MGENVNWADRPKEQLVARVKWLEIMLKEYERRIALHEDGLLKVNQILETQKGREQWKSK